VHQDLLGHRAVGEYVQEIGFRGEVIPAVVVFDTFGQYEVPKFYELLFLVGINSKYRRATMSLQSQFTKTSTLKKYIT
jgi:hypothetical protein